ncbi:DUF1828 domain-containing protein [Lactobacillus crispatus]|uniref:DUF1828 domain-containing protein n=1 Tax=Lactobacillus crispatus TaxID=47770 RepID=UPI0029C2E585|nr:DUF1828 domain-containing protein [Lactobacillus crispatus]MDX5064373.1 DUF1828 domain-containing protein [Lactobacillus crispatus]MDX5106590.1 DUF1828 domain-containing protein [Lactobacillus crispatus]
MFDVEKMKKIYFDWIDKKIQFVPSKNQDYMTITTPFLDMYNDYIELVIAQGNTSKYIISDDGYTINGDCKIVCVRMNDSLNLFL